MVGVCGITEPYESMTWTLSLADRKRLEAFEMWIWRRMERVSWKDKVTNVDVLQGVSDARNVLHAAWCQKTAGLHMFLNMVAF